MDHAVGRSDGRVTDSSALSSSGRRASLPDALSMKISSQRAAVSASRCDSGFWSRVETRPLADPHDPKRIANPRQQDIGADTAGDTHPTWGNATPSGVPPETFVTETNNRQSSSEPAEAAAPAARKAYRIYADRLTAAAILTDPAWRRVVRSVA